MGNCEYLYSILSLYLKKENDEKKTNLSISKMKDKVVFGFNMKKNTLDKTTYDLPLDMIDSCISKIITVEYCHFCKYTC